MNNVTLLDPNSHDQVCVVNDRRSGLRAIIALHDLRAGRTMGATRIYPYANANEAMNDALRLSAGMTLKAACANIPVGGAKAVLIADPAHKTRSMLHSYGDMVEMLKGRFVTGQDLNMSTDDVATVGERTRHVVGARGRNGGPVDATADGVMYGIKAAVSFQMGRDNLHGVRVAIQGVGNVGRALAHRLHVAGALLVLADADLNRATDVARELSAEVVSSRQIYHADVDVFAPCSVGGVLNDSSIKALRARIVAGCANNQLADENRHANTLHARNILYSPDFVINAGGLINVYGELTQSDEATERVKLEGIGHTLRDIFQAARQQGVSPQLVAKDLAARRLGGV